MAKNPLVLVVEDDRSLAEHIAGCLLGSKKYEVINAYNGLEALDLVNANKSRLGRDGNAIKCIILDLKMPVMDGLQFLKSLRQQEKNKHIPVIVLTAYEDQQKWLSVTHPQHGMASQYLKKPFLRKDLLSVVERIMNGESEQMIRQTLQEGYDKLTQFIETQGVAGDVAVQPKASRDYKCTIVSALGENYGILSAANHYSADHVLVFQSKTQDAAQQRSLGLLEDSLGTIIDIEKRTIETESVNAIAGYVVDYIDQLSPQTNVIVDLNSGTTVQVLGLLFGAYARYSRIKQIIYVDQDSKAIFQIPKMAYDINEGQRNILAYIQKHPGITTLELVQAQDLSQALIYKYVRELMDLNALEKSKEKLILTEVGALLLL